MSAWSPPGQTREEYVRALDEEGKRAREAEVAAWGWTPEKAQRFLELWTQGVFK